MPEQARRLGRPERAKIDPSRLDIRSDRPFRPTKSPEMARKGSRRAIFVDLGLIFGPFGDQNGSKSPSKKLIIFTVKIDHRKRGKIRDRGAIPIIDGSYFGAQGSLGDIGGNNYNNPVTCYLTTPLGQRPGEF